MNVGTLEGQRHAQKLLAHTKNLCHRVALSAVVVVLMEFICNKGINPSPHLPFDIGAQRKSAAGPSDRKAALGILGNLPQPFLNRLILGEGKVISGKRLVDPTKIRYFGQRPCRAPKAVEPILLFPEPHSATMRATVSHNDANGVEVVDDVLHILKPVRLIWISTRNGNRSLLQGPLQNLYYIFAVGPQFAPVNQGIQDTISKLRNQGYSGFTIQFFKKAASVPFRNKDVALSRLDGSLRACHF